MKSRHAFDSLAVRDGRVFGWGWFLSEQSPAHRIELLVRHADGRQTVLRCSRAGTRPDLAEAYPQVAHAGSAGYLLQGRLPPEQPEDHAELHVWLANGEHEVHALPGFPHRYAAGNALAGLRNRRVMLMDLLRHGDLVVLARRLAAWIRRRARERQRRSQALTPRTGAAGLDRLIIDHAMGGGANHFREEKRRAWTAAGDTVALLTPHLPTLEYELSVFGPAGESVARYPRLTDALAAVGPCGEIVVNNLVSFDDPLAVLAWIGLRRNAGAKTRYYLHDYHAACPVWTLVDESGRDCGVPGLPRCAQCLAANEAPFLGLMPSLDLVAWRREWGEFLSNADRRIAFSMASVAVLRKAFPALAPSAFELRPHNTDYLPDARVEAPIGPITVIGIVGTINAYKGAALVREMAELIDSERLPARIVVIGTLDDAVASPALRVTGPYRPEQLPELLRGEGVNVAFLPSIWHETFSYVTAELMHYGLPLAVFDLGAPAERVRAYDKGCIIKDIDPRAALDRLIGFQRQLAASHAEPGNGRGTPSPELQ